LPADTPLACLDLALTIAREYGAQTKAYTAALFLGNLAIANNDVEGVQKYLGILREICDPKHAAQVVNLLAVEAAALALAGDSTSARATADRALDLARERNFPESERWSLLVSRQRIEIATGDPARARQTLLDEAARVPEGMRRTFTEILADVALAASALRTGGGIPVDVTRSIMQRACANAWPGFANLLTTIAAHLCADALKLGIEPEFTRRMIRERNVPAPDPYEPHWPWPVRIHALGTLQVDVDEKPIAFGARVPRKPLELLKLLIARGPAPIDATVALDALWPQAEGPDARGAYDMAILRLRKLLGHEDALRLDGGRIGLDPACVWVDAFAFQHGAIEHYPGPLFGDEAVASWWASARERLHQRFLRRTAERAGTLERDGDFEQALGLYEAGLAQDSLAENLYRGAIRCHLAAGRAADALRVYRRCRDQLSIVLGVRPSAITTALIADLTPS
jgi:DNA-binding SARP family transcriptional activator